MRTATIQNFTEEPLKVLSWVESGETVEIFRDGVVIASVSPVQAVAASSAQKPRTPEEIQQYIRNRPPPSGPYSEFTGAELVSYGRRAI